MYLNSRCLWIRFIHPQDQSALLCGHLRYDVKLGLRRPFSVASQFDHCSANGANTVRDAKDASYYSAGERLRGARSRCILDCQNLAHLIQCRTKCESVRTIGDWNEIFRRRIFLRTVSSCLFRDRGSAQRLGRAVASVGKVHDLDPSLDQRLHDDLNYRLAEVQSLAWPGTESNQ